MRAVVWPPKAVEDLTRIVSYIEQFDELAAARLYQRVRRKTEQLTDFPYVGRPIGRGLRQLVLYPYLIRYRVHADHVEIVSVRHGRRRG